MFPLAAIGAGIGQGVSQINQGNESQMRLVLARLMQQQQLRELQAKGLMGEALMAGGLPGLSGGNALGGMGGLNLPGTTRLPGADMPLPADWREDAGPGINPNAPGAGGGSRWREQNGLGPISQFTEEPPPMSGPAMAPAGPAYIPPEQDNGTPTGDAPIPLEGSAPLEPSAADMARKEPQIDYAADTPAAAPGAPQGAGSAAATTAMPQQAAPAAAHEIPAYLSMFQKIDPSAIARRIKEIRPNADPAAVAMAVEGLYKMAHSGAQQQIAAASMMKYLIGDATKNRIADQTHEDRGRTLDTRVGIADANRAATGANQDRRMDVRQSEGALTRNAAMDRVRARLDARAAEAEKSAPQKADRDAVREMRGRVTDLKKRIDAIDMGPVNADTKAQRESLGRQMDEMLGALQKRTDAIMGKAPAGAE